MHFCLVDAVLERSEDRIVTLKQVSNAEEYLLDHFAGFPVLPGVFMIESLVQAARTLLDQTDPASPRMVLGAVRGVKYGSFVRPGDGLRVEVSVYKRLDDGHVEFKGEGRIVQPAPANSITDSAPVPSERVAVSGRFTLRPLNLPTN